MSNFSLDNFDRPKLEMPNKEKKLLLHSCCAPCAGEIMEAVAASGIELIPPRQIMARLSMNY